MYSICSPLVGKKNGLQARSIFCNKRNRRMAKHSSDNESRTSSGDRTLMLQLYEEADSLKTADTLAAEKAVEKGLSLAIQLQDLHYHFEFCYLLGRVYTLQGRLKEAHSVLQDGLTIARKHFPKDKRKLSIITNAIGIVYYSEDNRELALDYFLKALQFGAKELKLKILNNLGNTYTIIENHEKALAYFEKAQIEAIRENNRYMLAALLLNSTTSLIHFGDFDKARQYSEKSLSITDENIKSGFHPSEDTCPNDFGRYHDAFG